MPRYKENSMILEQIFSKTKEDLELKKAKFSFKDLEKKAASFKRAFKDVLKSLSKNDKGLNIIAEVKKASPSKGVIRSDFKPLEIAKEYEKAGAATISVLTEPHFFQGDLSYLKNISQSVKVPLLRKDFILDEYQILEAFLNGADFVLLIAKMLDKNTLLRLFNFAKSLNLEVLFEVHDEKELEKALFVGANIIGINQRNLNDFSIDNKLCEKLLPKISKDKIIVAESALSSHNELLRLDDLGVSAFLIGEYFMRQVDISKALKDFVKRT